MSWERGDTLSCVDTTTWYWSYYTICHVKIALLCCSVEVWKPSHICKGLLCPYILYLILGIWTALFVCLFVCCIGGVYCMSCDSSTWFDSVAFSCVKKVVFLAMYNGYEKSFCVNYDGGRNISIVMRNLCRQIDLTLPTLPNIQS